MKVSILIICLVLSACTACTTPVPLSPRPHPPAPIVTGHYIIRSFDVNGALKKMWITDNYKETRFPRSVTFTADGKKTTLTGSYEVKRTNK